ncbi:response regulator [Methylobacterium sp. Leaf469]|uniref:response regulator n=1 Tax=unclassified Methylobacterium TaxID=2615210 RepID=UPI0006FE9060|nr:MULTISPECIES: response regulator [unclassified Methylobacterium]USU33566.1 response regulator [Methylobacterium sp. OTU13CASTA1]KQO69451.1 response regulator [Methylobacterium sp. Leaf87]KQP34462.1 response regulator [Methylobacterium sp. Leaf102]KQP36858.1 response regulator [Methylobacterium sp. Leaf100]KQP72181.1 response regulator [Methylobacterium sp. Leaf112]
MSEPLRVLIAEDEALVAMQLEFLLEDCGHAVVGTADTAQGAIRLARETQPDIVFVDLQLRGGSSGLDIVRTLRDESDAMLVFVTANARRFSEDFEGAVGVIAKPFSEAVILDTIAYLEACVRNPPPTMDAPLGLNLAPDYRAQMDSLRD